MKLYILILLLIFIVSCASVSQVENAVNENLKQKNKLTDVKNEVTEITVLAQKLEQRSRGLDAFRSYPKAESLRECNLTLENIKKDTTDLDNRIIKLPEDYRNKLIPIIGELNQCASCTKDTLNDCKKARASINQAIKELYP